MAEWKAVEEAQLASLRTAEEQAEVEAAAAEEALRGKEYRLAAWASRAEASDQLVQFKEGAGERKMWRAGTSKINMAQNLALGGLVMAEGKQHESHDKEKPKKRAVEKRLQRAGMIAEMGVKK